MNLGIYNTLQHLLWAFASANSKSKIRAPEPFPAPVDKAKKKEHRPGSFAAVALAALNRTKRKGT